MKIIPLALLLLIGSDGPTIRVSSQRPMEGTAIRVTCHVPALAPSDFYDLEVGIRPVQSSTRHVPTTPWTLEFIFEHVPCDAEFAYCGLVMEMETRIAQLPIFVAGCEH